ncbi:hypothetical protein PAMP_016271 [Pampus punctatissimus]
MASRETFSVGGQRSTLHPSCLPVLLKNTSADSAGAKVSFTPGLPTKGRSLCMFLPPPCCLHSFPPALWLLLAQYQQVPVVLVGNKVDLEEEREVSPSEGQALAEDWGCPFMETSAKSKTMVDELFAEIVRQMDFCPLPDRREACCPTCSVQ